MIKKMLIVGGGADAQSLVNRPVAARPPAPSAPVLDEILAARTRRGPGAEALRRNQDQAAAWCRRFAEDGAYLPIPKPEGSAAGIVALYARLFAPLKSWLAGAGAVLAAELALRYRAWRLDRGVQTYADQVFKIAKALPEYDQMFQITGVPTVNSSKARTASAAYMSVGPPPI